VCDVHAAEKKHREAPKKEDINLALEIIGEFFKIPNIEKTWIVRFFGDLNEHLTELHACHFKPIADMFVTLNYNATPEIFGCLKKLKGVDFKCKHVCLAANKMEKTCHPKLNPKYEGIAKSISMLAKPEYHKERHHCALDAFKEVNKGDKKYEVVNTFVPCMEKALDNFFNLATKCPDTPVGNTTAA